MMISVIIPCYNAGEYISACISSLLGQSYQNWEAIFVNDGSTDNSLRLLQEFAIKDERINVYTQHNQGAAKARELGINKAKGEFVTFLDVDDTLSPNALEVMFTAFEPNTDIVVAGFNIIGYGKAIKQKQFSSNNFQSIDYLKKVLCGKYGWELWAKMYRRDLFSPLLKMPLGIRIGEDAAIFVQLVSRANKVKVLSDRVYNYIQYPLSASHVKSMQYAEETLRAAFFIGNLLKKEAFYEQVKAEIDAMFLLFYSNSSRKGKLGKEHPLVKEIRKKHFSLSAFRKISFYKSIYICLHYYLGISR